MQGSSKFPLISGNLSVDLVNTEVVRRGSRHDLLIHEEDIRQWLHTVKEQLLFWSRSEDDIQKQLSSIKAALLEMRAVLRAQFEAVADTKTISNELVTYLEELIAKAPLSYKLINQQLAAIPLGSIEDMILSIIALDALTLIADNKLTALKRCSNTDCVLLFIDESGRRKWCSMKICGNRKKVAAHHHRQTE